MTDIAQQTMHAGGRNLGMLKSPWSVVVAVPVLIFLFDRANTLPVIDFAARAFAGTLPYILVAVIMIAWLKAASAEAYATRVFEGRENRMIVFAALVGGLAPFCSCEVIPFIAGLLALGAPLSAIMAFWLSSPLVDPPTLVITASALGWPFAVGKAASAVFIGLAGGFAIKSACAAGLFSNPLRPRPGSSCCGGPKPDDSKPRWAFWHEAQRREIFRSEFVANGMFLVKWLAFAYVMEALLVAYVPASLIATSVGGNGIGSIVTAAVVGMPAYLNGYVAPPLLAGLMDQGMGAGAAMAFMVAGAVSSIPAMAAVWSLVNRGVFASYLALGVSGAIISGIVFQTIV